MVKDIMKLDYEWFKNKTDLVFLPDKAHHIKCIRNGYAITKQEINPDPIKVDYPKPPQHQQYVLQKVLKGIHQGYIWGPFDPKDPPFTTYHLNPTYVIEKRLTDGSIKYRQIMDLSAPHSTTKTSINDCILPSEKTTQYPSIRDIAAKLSEMDGDGLLWVIDMADAYHRISIHNSHVRWMGFTILGLLFFYTCLVFGCASSCQLFNEFAQLLCLVLVYKHPNIFLSGVTPQIDHYLDDFWGWGRKDEMVWHQGEFKLKVQVQFDLLLHQLKMYNIPSQPRKVAPPATEQVLLGFVFDMVGQQVYIPTDKINDTLATANMILQKPNGTRISVAILRHFTGRVRWMTQVVWTGAANVRRLEQVQAAIPTKFGKIKVREWWKKDVRWWQSILRNLKNRGMCSIWIYMLI